MYHPIPNPFGTQIGTDMLAAPLEALQTARNRTAYGALANEYEDPSHATIADFHRLTAELFRRLSTDICRAMPVFAGDWLVAGVGTGANVADFIAATGGRPPRLEAVDLCPEMLEQAVRSDIRYDKLSETDLTQEPGHQFAHFQVILAFLADPYLDEQGFRSLTARLRPRGRLVVTVPSRTWADLVRKGQHPDEAWFNLFDGQRLSAPSFCWDIDELVTLGMRAGLRPLVTAEAMHTDARLESTIIRDAAEAIQPHRLNVLSLAVFARD